MCGRGEYSLKTGRHKEQNGKTADFKWSVFPAGARRFKRLKKRDFNRSRPFATVPGQ